MRLFRYDENMRVWNLGSRSSIELGTLDTDLDIIHPDAIANMPHNKGMKAPMCSM